MIITRTEPLSAHPLYIVWNGMRSRCTNPNYHNYRTHGGAGIKVAWESFPAFRDWALANGYRPGLTLNRINRKKDFGPDNCRWVKSYSRTEAKAVVRSDGRRFESLIAAARETPHSHTFGISLVCQGRQGKCGGYTWRYAE